jgi:GNAT superfamily N-acetyltransferase
MDYRIEGPVALSARVAESVLRELTAWFGIEEYLLEYARQAESGVNLIAYGGDAVVGFVTLLRRTEACVEISCMGVLPDWQRRGIGRALCDATARWWERQGGRLLQVKTLGPSRPDANYERTRAFYRAQGFLPVEEFTNLWAENPCLLMVRCLS